MGQCPSSCRLVVISRHPCLATASAPTAPSPYFQVALAPILEPGGRDAVIYKSWSLIGESRHSDV